VVRSHAEISTDSKVQITMVSSFDYFNILFKNPVILSKNKTKDAVETTAFPKTINYSTDILQKICGFDCDLSDYNLHIGSRLLDE
jgi:hypothetical protein